MTFGDLDEPQSGWLSYSGHVAEYMAARSAWVLELPPNYTIPSEPAPEPEVGTLYQRGAGEVAVLFHWLYAVERAAVNAHRSGDSVAAQYWVRVAAKHVETDVYARFNDTDVPVSWYDAIIVPAQAGDFGPISAEVDGYFQRASEPE